MRNTILCVFCLAVSAMALVAQREKADAPAGTTVSGHVFCADTNAPARMATVILQPAEVAEAIGTPQEDQVPYHGEVADTLFDGSFSIQHVPPGVYYVIASQAGYLHPLAPVYLAAKDHSSTDGKSDKKPAPAAPRITVQGNVPVVVNVSIERGAAVSGTILYDDGSPASGLNVTAMVHSKNDWVSFPTTPAQKSFSFTTTDDEGRYRISGLPAGKYILATQIRIDKLTYSVEAHGGSESSAGSSASMTVYSGGASRENKAVPFKLAEGEERHGEDMEIPVGKLHTVRGSLIAAHDGHVLNGGSVSLFYADDNSAAANISLSKEDDGFTLNFVLEGDYFLNVDDASDVDYQEVPNPAGFLPPTRTEPVVLRRYGPVRQHLHVEGDVSGLTISVPDIPQQKAQAAQ